MKPTPATDVVIFRNGWISPRSPAGHRACKRGGVQCASEQAARAWADERGLTYAKPMSFTAQVRRTEKLHRQPNRDARWNRRFAIKLVAAVNSDEAADGRSPMKKYNTQQRGTYRAEMRREAK